MCLSVDNLTVFSGRKKLIDGVTLKINHGELHALLGPNGSGKSTLVQALMGNPQYAVSENSAIFLEGKNISGKKVDERARMGLFLAFQNPVNIPGVSVVDILRMAYRTKEKSNNSGAEQKHNPILSVWKINELIYEEAKKIGIPSEFLKRKLDGRFSGGEKKKLEILQAMVLQPKVALFDEIDTGLDVDALKIVGTAIDSLKSRTAVLLITHQQKILHHLKPTSVHVLVSGKIVESGNYRLINEIETYGFKKWLLKASPRV